jgi:uncharacterized protein YqjF (DUF2071 family)
MSNGLPIADPTETRTRRFLTAEWRHLLMLNYEIDPAVLQPFVPRGTEIDTWNGRTFASIVAFHYSNTRLWGLPIPFHRDFDEINFRFYVRRPTAAGYRRGVVFIKEVVPRIAVATIARRFYNENFVCHPMRFQVRMPTPAHRGFVEYAWVCPSGTNVVRAEFSGQPELPAPDSQEEFITEHYWGYSILRDGSTCEYRVDHPPWRVWPAARAEFKCDVSRFYGPQFEPALGRGPFSAFVAEGSPVTVYRGRCIA